MKRFLTLLTFCISALNTKSQVLDAYITDNYSPEVITRLYNLVVKTNINSAKQIAIADIYKTQDSALALMIKSNETKRAIDSVNNLYQNSWKAILSATDEFYYSTATASENKTLRYTYTLLSLAINSKTELGLSEPSTIYLLSKIDSLKIKEDLFYQQSPNQYFNSYSLQNQYINAIFSDAQYKKLMELKGMSKAKDKAKVDWEELNQLGLASGLNYDSTFPMFVNFYLSKDFISGRYQKNSAARRNAFQNLYSTEPDPIRKLYYARKYKNAQGNNKPVNFSQFLFAVKNTDKLGLNESQVKDLFTKASDVEKLKEEAYLADSTKPYDARAYECTNLKAILTVSQYDQFLIAKNSGRAKNSAIADWRELTQRNMIQGHSRDSTLAELSNYYLQFLSIIDANEDDQVKEADLLKNLAADKPRALIALLKARYSPDNDTQGQGYIW